MPEDGYFYFKPGFIVYTAPTEEDLINEEEGGSRRAVVFYAGAASTFSA